MSSKTWLIIIGIVMLFMSIVSFFDWFVQMPVWAGIVVLLLGIYSLYLPSTQKEE